MEARQATSFHPHLRALGGGCIIAAALLFYLDLLQAQTRLPDARIETVIITLKHHGFVPKRITRKAGPFLLFVSNRSGQRELSLTLTTGRLTPLRPVQIPVQRRNWSESFNLAPGIYLLTDPVYPSWTCTIEILPL